MPYSLAMVDKVITLCLETHKSSSMGDIFRYSKDHKTGIKEKMQDGIKEQDLEGVIRETFEKLAPNQQADVWGCLIKETFMNGKILDLDDKSVACCWAVFINEVANILKEFLGQPDHNIFQSRNKGKTFDFSHFDQNKKEEVKNCFFNFMGQLIKLKQNDSVKVIHQLLHIARRVVADCKLKYPPVAKLLASPLRDGLKLKGRLGEPPLREEAELPIRKILGNFPERKESDLQTKNLGDSYEIFFIASWLDYLLQDPIFADQFVAEQYQGSQSSFAMVYETERLLNSLSIEKLVSRNVKSPKPERRSPINIHPSSFSFPFASSPKLDNKDKGKELLKKQQERNPQQEEGMSPLKALLPLRSLKRLSNSPSKLSSAAPCMLNSPPSPSSLDSSPNSASSSTSSTSPASSSSSSPASSASSSKSTSPLPSPCDSGDGSAEKIKEAMALHPNRP